MNIKSHVVWLWCKEILAWINNTSNHKHVLLLLKQICWNMLAVILYDVFLLILWFLSHKTTWNGIPTNSLSTLEASAYIMNATSMVSIKISGNYIAFQITLWWGTPILYLVCVRSLRWFLHDTLNQWWIHINKFMGINLCYRLHFILLGNL